MKEYHEACVVGGVCTIGRRCGGAEGGGDGCVASAPYFTFARNSSSNARTDAAASVAVTTPPLAVVANVLPAAAVVEDVGVGATEYWPMDLTAAS